MKKCLYLLLILLLLPLAVHADDSGPCGNNVSYVYEEATRTLTISGTGAMQNYSNSSSAPWYSYKSDIKKLVLNEGVTSIGNYVFRYCSGLTSIEIPNSVTSIGNYAFSGCSGLTSIEIPNSVTSIGNSAFYDCSGLTSINVESGNTKYDSRDNCNAIIEISSNTLIAGCKNTIIPNSVTSIGQRAFSGCSGLTSIVIPNSVTSIGESAFRYCSGLTSIEIPNSVTSIGNTAFYECRGLTSIVIPNSVTSIGNTAFSGCSGLTSIVIPNSVTSIGESAFRYCSGLTSIEIPNSVTSIGNNAFQSCSGLTSIVIPNSVTSIGDNAFSDCRGLTSIEIPNSVTSIGNNAFQSCSGLTSIVIPNSVTSIGAGAFSGCSGLTSIVIPNSVTSIGHNAFVDCSGLTSIVIPNSVTSIGNYAFIGCSGLTSINVESGNTKYDSRDNCNAIIEASSNTLIAGCKNTIIPNSVTSIGGSAFSDCFGLTSIVIPNSVTSIGNYAFIGCSGLTSIVIPNSVTSIGERAFSDCSGLTSINVESGNTTYNSHDNCNAIIETSSKTLIAGCKNTIIPNSVTSIGERAFQNCSGLTSIEIPNSVTSIGVDAFSYCSGLTSIEIPNSVTSIGNFAFYDCSGLTSIVIPNSVTSIGNYAFIGCSGLTSINVESGNTKYDSRDNCNAIIEASSNTLIAGCKNTIIPNSVTSIGERAFSGCFGLTSIVIPNSVTSIGNSAFQWCSGLKSIEIPNSVTSISGSAFEGCSGLTSIVIPNSVTSIGDLVFSDCRGLTSIEIPNSVTTIGNYAFSYCSGLTSVTCLAEKVPTTNSYAFTNSSIGSATLYVPEGCKVAYEAADVWKDFKEIVEIEVAPTPSNDALLSVQDTKGYIGKTVSADIDLTNSTEDLTAYQFDLTLPEGLSLSQNDKGKFLVTKTSRYEDDSQTLNISKLEDNTYRFVCFSMSNEVIIGTSGAILNASLTIGESVSEGSYEAAISNIVVTKTDGTQLKLSDSKFNIVVTNVIKGDANGDGEVNVSDIVEIVNYIMNKPSDKFVFAAADVNEDGEVNVTDIVKVVSIIMSANSSQAKMSAAQTEMTDNDQVQLVDNEDQTISLTLNNEGGYVASQFDLVLSDNQSLESITLNNNRTDNHILAYTKTGENRYRVLSYSLNNATYDGHSGELLDIKVAGNGDVSVEDILFVTAEETEKRFSPLHSVTTGISVTTKQAEAVDIYGIDGRLVHKQAKSMDGLERGIYIINGKKHIVR